MIVVADTSPINYLIQISCIDLLPTLFGAVHLPEAVFAELQHVGAPVEVRRWSSYIASSFRPNSDSIIDLLCEHFRVGGLQEIGLATVLGVELLLICEVCGRAAAKQIGLQIGGSSQNWRSLTTVEYSTGYPRRSNYSPPLASEQ